MVLNDQSTHPNPFRNPMPYNLCHGFYYHQRIYKGIPDSIHDKDWDVKPRDNIMLTKPLSYRLYLAGKKGFVLASAMAWADILVNRPLAPPKEKLGRFCHFTIPITASFVSYVAARDFLGVVSEKNGGKFDDDWTFLMAMTAPGAIIGSWYSVRGGIWLSVYGGIASFAYKKMCDVGEYVKNDAPDPTTKHHDFDTGQHLGNAWHWKWTGSKIYDKWDNKPDWKRWEEKEEQAK